MADGADLTRKLPFKAEYAKSGRAKCKLCANTIDKGELRLAIMVKSRFFDGMQETWYHENCFFSRARPKSVGDIGHYESLRWEDQKRLEAEVASNSPTLKNGQDDFSDFTVEYAKSNRSNCPACEDNIPKQQVRIGIKDYESDSARSFGPAFRWYHVDCFVKCRESLDWTHSAEKLPGFRDLEEIDKQDLKNKLPALAKKRKLEENGNSQAKKQKIEKEEADRERKVKEQNQMIYKMRDTLKHAREDKLLSAKDLQSLLEYNKQEVPSSSESLLDRLADIMTFGALLPCKKCKEGQYVYRSGVGYVCMGYLTEYTKCENVNPEPERTVFKVPRRFREDNEVDFLVKYKQKEVTQRVIPKHAVVTVKPSTSQASTSGYKGPKIVKNPLKNFKFYVDPTLDKEDIKTKIEKFGGKLTNTISSRSRLAAAISTQDTISEGKEKFIKSCRDRKIPIVSVDFVDNLREVDYKLTEQIQVNLIVDWIKPMEVGLHLNTINPDFDKSKEKESRLELDLKKVKLKMKDGAVVDPDSGLEDSSHVYKDGSKYYSVILSQVNIEEDINRYYKLQLIESDRKNQYSIFRAWGRLGTTVGGYQTDTQPTLEDAVDQFKKLFAEKTGNDFDKPFKLKPGKYSWMDINYGEKEKLKELVPSKKDSNLDLPVQELIAKIFNIDDMQATLLEFEIDLAKMPLGKLSQKQILKAYDVLNQAMQLIEGKPQEHGHHKLVADLTNRFFTLIPHSFGMKGLPRLEEKDFIKNKLEMLESLMDIELAYELLVEGNKEEGSPIDAHYRTLKCDIVVMEKNSPTYEIIKKYLKNTHAETHDQYGLELANIFVINRKGEGKRYDKHQDLPNKQLLWHGSRTSNYGGILSKGLRIAPPEAPVTGYMFGKGIYFADMVSKSANYCYVHPSGSNTGLLLLCEVALGDMHELTDAKETLLKPPQGKHSVKGNGKMMPDPAEQTTLPSGALVPYGKPVKSPVKKSSLLYNEYIVYDVEQVKMSYLVEVNFKFKNRRR